MVTFLFGEIMLLHSLHQHLFKCFPRWLLFLCTLQHGFAYGSECSTASLILHHIFQEVVRNLPVRLYRSAFHICTPDCEELWNMVHNSAMVADKFQLGTLKCCSSRC